MNQNVHKHLVQLGDKLTRFQGHGVEGQGYATTTLHRGRHRSSNKTSYFSVNCRIAFGPVLSTAIPNPFQLQYHRPRPKFWLTVDV